MYPPEKAAFRSLALSPDGRNLAFSAITGTRSALWIRPLDSLTPRLVVGTDGAYNPFWSPDGRFVAFFTLGALKKTEVGMPSGNSSPQTLFVGDTHAPARGTWNAHDIIVFNATSNRPLLQIPGTGLPLLPLTALDGSRQETFHTFPRFLPDGRRFLFAAHSIAAENTGIFAGSLDAPHVERVLGGSSSFSYVRFDGRDYLLLLRGGALAAQAFDTDNLKLRGEPHVLAERVGEYTVSETGVLAYLDAVDTVTRLSWFDQQGRSDEALPATPGLNDVSVSPDGMRVAAVIRTKGASSAADLWVVDLRRGTKMRLTFHPGGVQGCPVWSPDGNTLVYSADWKGEYNLYSRATSGAGDEVQLLPPPATGRCATSWSRDGRFLVYQEYDSKGIHDLWILPMQGDRKPFLFLQTGFSERQGQFSPDGRWMAYTSDESGEREIYVRPFRVVGSAPSSSADGKWRISKHGGHSPKWRPDGKELFYIANDRKLIAVPIQSAGSNFNPGAARFLFELNSFASSSNFVYRYDISPDGHRFLVDDVAEETSSSPITVLLNWPAALRK